MRMMQNTALFTNMLNVMNQSLKENQDRFPYDQLLKASERLADGFRICVAVYNDDDPDNADEYYTIEFRDGQYQLVDDGDQCSDISWKVSSDYLNQICENPDEYIEHPTRFEWDWLKDRLGVSRD